MSRYCVLLFLPFHLRLWLAGIYSECGTCIAYANFYILIVMHVCRQYIATEYLRGDRIQMYNIMHGNYWRKWYPLLMLRADKSAKKKWSHTINFIKARSQLNQWSRRQLPVPWTPDLKGLGKSPPQAWK